MLINLRRLGLYIHFPFCENKCPYCDFYSSVYDENTKDLYETSLKKEIKNWSDKLCSSQIVDSVYLGGGTPNLFGSSRISSILDTIYHNFNVDSNAEITMEMNPNLSSSTDFTALKKSGLNRLSIGLQSANKNELRSLGRKHTSQDVKTSVLKAQKAGIKNISLDIMLCIENQNTNSLKNTIDFCKSLNIKHISSYVLKIEPNTPYFERAPQMKLPNESEQEKIFLYCCEYLERFGYNQYEISNFALKGYESVHNLKYWNLSEYLGIGPSAHSFLDNKRFYTRASIKDFLIKPKYLPEEDGIHIKNGSELEYIMLRLRLKDGLQQDLFTKHFGYSIPKKYFENAKKLQDTNLVRVTNNSVALTRKGFLLSNTLICEILFGGSYYVANQCSNDRT